MKRLTKRYASHIAVVCDNCKEKGSYCDTSVCRDVMRNRLAEYEDMEEQGLLVRLPCKLGGMVYVIHKGDYKHNWKPYVDEMYVVEINHKYDRSGKDIEWGLVLHSIINGTRRIRYRISNVGKAVYLSREAAEKALEE